MSANVKFLKLFCIIPRQRKKQYQFYNNIYISNILALILILENISCTVLTN